MGTKPCMPICPVGFVGELEKFRASENLSIVTQRLERNLENARYVDTRLEALRCPQKVQENSV
jgi:hypothetical protein